MKRRPRDSRSPLGALKCPTPNLSVNIPLRAPSRGDGDPSHRDRPERRKLFPSGVEHSVTIIEDYTTINCKDIVPGWSVYNAGWER
jgi:hypothetical protein